MALILDLLCVKFQNTKRDFMAIFLASQAILLMGMILRGIMVSWRHQWGAQRAPGSSRRITPAARRWDGEVEAGSGDTGSLLEHVPAVYVPGLTHGYDDVGKRVYLSEPFPHLPM